MNTADSADEILCAVSYKPGWDLQVTMDEAGRQVIQWAVESGVCSVSGKPVMWKSGKRTLSPHMCRQEIVAACFSLALAAEEHECREWFRYKGASIFNPHLDPDVLAEVARKASSFNVRANAMQPE